MNFIFETSEDFKKELIIEVGKAFYITASALTGTKPPWGVLTGIRPAKIAEKAFEDEDSDSGENKSKVIEILTKKYLMSEKKAEIAVDTYLNAKNVLNSHNNLTQATHSKDKDKEVSLYVSIPFCPTKCRYCSFVSYSTPKLLKLIPEYMRVLLQEIEKISATIKEKELVLKTIYIGGGTPTTLDCDALNMLLKKIEQCFDMSNIIEYTVEAGRPDTITKSKLDLFKNYRIDRISINPQTLNDDILINIGRCHTSGDFFDAYKTARECGIKNINTDCIVGLFGEDKTSMIETAKKLIELEPENITVHTLCIKKSSAIKTDNIGGNNDIYKPYAPDVNYALEAIYELLYKNGYLPYYMYRQKYSVGNLENTGFSKKNHECMYNIYMMDELQTIYGAGAGATTKIVYPDGRIERIINHKYPYEYIDIDI
jgi:oxygen-independent coproporphyrinogen-3 oxidase